LISRKEDATVNRHVLIIVGVLVAACLVLLLPSCATAPGREVSVDAARQTLQAQYPNLLQSFDLHQGVFSVTATAWDTLSSARRSEFLLRCGRSRLAVTGQSTVRVDTEGDVVAVADGGSSVIYGTSMTAGTDRPVEPPPGFAGAGSVPFLVLLSMPRPVYPAAALRAGVEGTVYLHARIGTDGRVREIMPIDGGIRLLNGAALEAGSKACFYPREGGEASEPVWVHIPMRFAIPKGTKTLDPRFPGSIGGVADAARLPESGRSPSAETVK
jgi:TonB family protein